METTKKILDYTRLNGEYLNWSLKYGDGRNNQDLRFGQYLHTKYWMTRFRTDIFYEESCEMTYSRLLTELHQTDKIK